jgi:PTS system nitrogen regulatory IIA component
MDLIGAFRDECVSVHSTQSSKEGVLKEIAALAAACPGVGNVSEETIFTGLESREELGSTGFQNGIAIPHCLLPQVSEFVVGMVTVKEGIDFASLDGAPTTLIPFIVGPSNDRTTHIRLLSAVSRVLSDTAVRNELLAAQSATALKESFLRTLGDTFKNDKSSKRNLILVTVQKEELFNDILQLFSEADECNLSVVEGHDSSEYLNSLPLFAEFWNNEQSGFHRIIQVSIRHSLANECLRRLQEFLEQKKVARGVLVQMLDIVYATGSLDM